ncbi:NADP-dependent isocitrate dehydrogenase [Caproiciproducens sp. NJN-50]|uniref:NADP-dependent isocitrate dehydrogenase n=1 Tax=Acutalibacteraceae TaxID=3082771 RepID=UPI000FFE0B8D|nr:MULTISPECIES: NADP-dependent isocitrate dehydrogenase [Acutalibacteraceae]QAT49804.1 NADP-dependent isocitrate dehydrogenase [Caproiciproducens sp. NJN-50]
MAEKIKMRTPLVEMDGDEMTRIIWKQIKDILLTPYVDLKTEYYDLGLKHRDETEDRVTEEAARAIEKYGVGVKCATITPNADRVKEYQLKKMWRSPNGTIRSILDGTVFRKPILVRGITPLVPSWKKPITVARHAYGDVYKNVEMTAPAGSKAELVVTDASGKESRTTIHDFQSAGVVQGVHNLDQSIADFAHSCFQYALEAKEDLWFSTKDTISKTYDHRFKDIFQKIFEEEYEEKFKRAGITYFYTLIDDAVARVVRSDGGFIWACKNYDGDVMSDLIATAFGSLAMMTSVLVSPKGIYEYEAAHGTVQRHYYRYLKGEKTSTNPIATLCAWTGALKKRGELDGTPELSGFADQLEAALLRTVESGIMTGDLAGISTLQSKETVDTETFLYAVRSRMNQS